jgi:type II secretory ATPase GspE/PulE/Tfp pilus assembly ATPase PilB-like protein
MAFFAFLGMPEPLAAAEATFPRGPGFYFSLPKLATFVLIYLMWLSTCNWVNHDASEVGLPADRWNLAMVSGAMLGMLMVWLVDSFLASLLFLWVLYLSPSLAYVYTRNQRVKPEERVLTERHLKELAQRFLKLKFRQKKDEEQDKGVPVRFIGRSFNQLEEDPARVARAEASRGYKAAREMVYEAIQRRATDIHLEPTKEEMSVRFRIDGILQATDPFARQMGDGVINIFKVLCNLDITEKRKPQDGSFSAQVEDRAVDFRVATAGSVAGEKMVMRILDKSQQIVSLKRLGMRDKMNNQIRQIVTEPHGMFIVCGPTGAGKSTTLYACLNEIDRLQRNIITIENPVEYQLENITQIEVNLKAGKTFASELRSILRQDPDVIMIGEIRDQETAEIACQAAQTGHMVFTTLHANDAITALGRLIDLGVKPFMVASAISAILGQRLVRLLCPKCKVRYKPNPDLLRKANLPADKIKYFYRPPESDDPEQGTCERCGGSGYYGRTGIFEMLVVSDRIRDLIRDNPNLNTIKQEAVKSGMRYLQEDGLRQVIEGKTSIQELLRVSK